jgi:hypothetical protein
MAESSHEVFWLRLCRAVKMSVDFTSRAMLPDSAAPIECPRGPKTCHLYAYFPAV